jgi:hypothetical protein
MFSMRQLSDARKSPAFVLPSKKRRLKRHVKSGAGTPGKGGGGGWETWVEASANHVSSAAQARGREKKNRSMAEISEIFLGGKGG